MEFLAKASSKDVYCPTMTKFIPSSPASFLEPLSAAVSIPCDGPIRCDSAVLSEGPSYLGQPDGSMVGMVAVSPPVCSYSWFWSWSEPWYWLLYPFMISCTLRTMSGRREEVWNSLRRRENWSGDSGFWAWRRWGEGWRGRGDLAAKGELRDGVSGLVIQ